MSRKRRIFFVVASGGHDTDRHYHDTIKRKRTVEEAASHLKKDEINQLNNYYHGQPFAVWGAVPGPGNIRTWETMEPGDYVLIYRSGRIILVAEVAMKARSASLAKHYWQEDREGRTWENVYFLINDVEVNVKQSDFNKYIGYNESYFPRGFSLIDQDKTDTLLSTYGDLISLLKKLESGEKLEEISRKKLQEISAIVDEKINRAPTEHDEMQWRLIRLGNAAHFDVWVPSSDQGRQYSGHAFKDFVLKEFREAMDIPSYIKNIDTVWKLGLSIKSAFEIEHSTSIYSGILRLSDLKALAPNSAYPLFIVAERDKRAKVFAQLRRPTFSNSYLQLDKYVRYLSYDAVRNLDENVKAENLTGFGTSWLVEASESVSSSE